MKKKIIGVYLNEPWVLHRMNLQDHIFMNVSLLLIVSSNGK